LWLSDNITATLWIAGRRALHRRSCPVDRSHLEPTIFVKRDSSTAPPTTRRSDEAPQRDLGRNPSSSSWRCDDLGRAADLFRPIHEPNGWPWMAGLAGKSRRYMGVRTTRSARSDAAKAPVRPGEGFATSSSKDPRDQARTCRPRGGTRFCRSCRVKRDAAVL